MQIKVNADFANSTLFSFTRAKHVVLTVHDCAYLTISLTPHTNSVFVDIPRCINNRGLLLDPV